MDVHSFSVDGHRLFIGERSTVSLYSLENVKLIKKFGRRGEGPSEFRTTPKLKVFPNLLVVNCIGKFLHFSLKGDFIMEKRVPNVFTLFIYPVGKNFVGIKVKSDRERGRILRIITLFDKEFRLIKKLSEISEKLKGKNSSGKIETDAIGDYFMHEVYDGNIYVGDTSKGFFIEVFDSSGKKVSEINNDKKIEKLKISHEFKKKFINALNNSSDPFDKMVKRRVKYVFREYFPAFKTFTVNDGKIYALTYKMTGDERRELVVMDLKGNILKKVFVTDAKYYSISNDRYYYLKDNTDKEEWELFMEEIK